MSEIEDNGITAEGCLDLAWLAAEASGSANAVKLTDLAQSYAAEGQLWLALADRIGK